MIVIFKKLVLNTSLVLLILILSGKTYPNEKPLLLQNNSTKKEKLREEELINY